MSFKINRVLIPIIVFCLLIFNHRTSTANRALNTISYLPIISDHQNGWLGPYGGYIVTTVIDPLDSRIAYAGTWGSGVYKSQDRGRTWQASNFGLGNLYINSLTIDPTQPTTLYAGTYKSQIYKSYDAGRTWVWSGSGMQDQAVVYSIAIDPYVPSTIYAGTRGISNNGTEPWSGVLYKSVDGGRSWSPSLTDVGGKEVQDWVYSIAINPTENNSVYIATHEHGPYHSNNYGSSWYSIHDGIKDDSGRAIIINPDTSDGTIMYYGVWHFDSVYKSLNGGNDWFLSDNGITFTKVYGMAIDPLDTDNVYLATFNRGILKTDDSGDNWAAGGLHDDLIYSLSIDVITPTNLIAGTAGDGIFSTTDSGATWQPSNFGIDNAMTTKVLISPINPKKLYTSVFGAGIYQSLDRGQSWTAMNTGLIDKFVHTLLQNPADSKILFALTDTGGLYRNDLSNSIGWENVQGGLPSVNILHPAFPVGHPFASPASLQSPDEAVTMLADSQLVSTNLLTMAFAPANPQIVYLGTGGSGVYKSVDNGLIWMPAGLAGESIQSLAVDTIDSNLVYAATLTPGSLKYSSNGGAAWVDLKLPVTFYSLATSPGTGSLLYAGTSDGIYRYAAGKWTHLGLDGKAITTITINPNNPSEIYTGTASGAYYTQDEGISWEMLDWNLKDLTIQSIDLGPVNLNQLFISTKTHGIYYTLANH